jgi:F-type H+-transporting ATPase subunit delta
MAEKRTLARPYAVAIFELALEQSLLSQVGEELTLCTLIANDSDGAILLSSPKTERSDKLALFTGVVAKPLAPVTVKLLQMVIENGRLNVLAEISEIYHEMQAQEQRTVTALVTSAVPLSSAMQSDITAALTKRLGCQVTLSCEVDSSILGGTIIRAGDMVIDSSIAGKLKQMSHALLH